MYVMGKWILPAALKMNVLKLLLHLKCCRRRHQKRDVLPMFISWDVFFKNCDLLSRSANDTQTQLLSNSKTPKLVRPKGAMNDSCWWCFQHQFGNSPRVKAYPMQQCNKHASEHESNYSSKRSVSNKSHVFMSQHCHRASAKVAVASRQTVAHRYRHGMRKKKQRVGWNTFAVRTWHDLTKADGPVVRWICSGTLACVIWNRCISQKNRDDHEERHLFWDVLRLLFVPSQICHNASSTSALLGLIFVDQMCTYLLPPIILLPM